MLLKIGGTSRALQAEMAEHLGHSKHEPVENATGNTRNGKSKKTLKGVRPQLFFKMAKDQKRT